MKGKPLPVGSFVETSLIVNSVKPTTFLAETLTMLNVFGVALQLIHATRHGTCLLFYLRTVYPLM